MSNRTVPAPVPPMWPRLDVSRRRRQPMIARVVNVGRQTECLTSSLRRKIDELRLSLVSHGGPRASSLSALMSYTLLGVQEYTTRRLAALLA